MRFRVFLCAKIAEIVQVARCKNFRAQLAARPLLLLLRRAAGCGLRAAPGCGLLLAAPPSSRRTPASLD